jgi:hypothetical protein
VEAVDAANTIQHDMGAAITSTHPQLSLMRLASLSGP